MQSLKRIGPESHALALRRGSDGAELAKKDLAAAVMAPPCLVAKGEKSAPLAPGLDKPYVVSIFVIAGTYGFSTFSPDWPSSGGRVRPSLACAARSVQIVTRERVCSAGKMRHSTLTFLAIAFSSPSIAFVGGVVPSCVLNRAGNDTSEEAMSYLNTVNNSSYLCTLDQINAIYDPANIACGQSGDPVRSSWPIR